MTTLHLYHFYLLKHCEDGDRTLVSNLHPDSSPLEAIPEPVPLQQPVNGQ